jgi:hypothetical protein
VPHREGKERQRYKMTSGNSFSTRVALGIFRRIWRETGEKV